MSAKFGCFNYLDKIINNLPRCGRFQPNFRCPLTAKLLTDLKKTLQDEMMARTASALYHHAKFGGNRENAVGVRGRNVMFSLFTGRICLFYRTLSHRTIFGFFAPHGRHVAPIKVKFGREERTICPEMTFPLKNIKISPGGKTETEGLPATSRIFADFFHRF